MIIWPPVGLYSSTEVLFKRVQREALLNVEKFSAFLKIPVPHIWLGTFQTSAVCKQDHFQTVV